MLEGTPLKVGERAVRDDEVLVAIKKTGKYRHFDFRTPSLTKVKASAAQMYVSVPCALGP
jgi:hypothetical protein